VGSRFWQASSAVRSRESLTPSCRRAVLEKCPLLSMGSGKFGIPWERTHRAKASPDGELADPPAFGELAVPVDDGLPPQAAVSRAAAMTVMMTAAARVLRGRGCRGPGPRPGRPLMISCLLAAGQGDCGFMAASVPAGGGGHITRRR